jgi:2-dehydropantoate 2-reductase
LVVEELDSSRSIYRIPGFYDPKAIPEKADLVIVAVKSYDTPKALSSTIQDCCQASTLFLTLQNGIGNWELISELVPKERVLAGVTAQGATLLSPGVVRHGGNGPTFIGEPKGPPSPRVDSLVELFRRAGLKTDTSEVMEQLIWEKLLVNVGINAITALTGIPNGVIAELDVARDLSRAAVAEAMVIARAKGFTIAESMPDRVLAVAKATAVNRSSMGQDVDRKAATEIDAINGAIVRFGEEISIPTPVNRTLAQLVKIMETNYLKTNHGNQLSED